ncbi:hypothetical protein EB796_022619 [Bugula neritina]|uniref:WAP domain-containing protein n=1 Tax=Bugula neritina TaxID=10212 RepID=A0A7J7J098_BUGNE|nr:hypothetical protein EB796_022619 [Bugula neritina]
MNLLTLATIILTYTELISVVATTNEQFLEISVEDTYRLIPDKKAGARSVRQPAADALCRECIIKSRYAYDRFQQYTYLNFYDQNPNVTNSDELAGIKTCREYKEVLNCYNQCFMNISAAEIEEVEASLDYKSTLRVDLLYCEERYTPGHTSCRLADTHRCDKIRRSNCGDSLTEHAECLTTLLSASGQNCSGHCTPARRFLQSQKFIWDTECSLSATYNYQCKGIITLFCFKQLKDTEANYGIYQRMDSIPAMADNLTHTCQILESPFACIEEATNGFYDYFGFNITYACRGAEDTIDSVKRQWRSIINPYCGASVPENYTTVEDVCPMPEPTLPPSTVPTTTTTTTRVVPSTGNPTTKVIPPANMPKPGRCPRKPDTICDASCVDDVQCNGREKCCSGCCRSPLFRRGSVRAAAAGGSVNSSPTSILLSPLTLTQILLATIFFANI